MKMSTPLIMPLALMMTCSIITLSSKQWVIMWMLLELSTVGFILFLSMETKKEKNITFFVFQTLPSILIMVTIFNENWSWEQANKTTFLLVVISIFIKIGVFPFNTWMMKFNSSINWVSLTIILTWQKIIPITIMMKWSQKNSTIAAMMISLACMSVILLKTTNMKVLISVSSIIHNLWAMLPMFMMKLYSALYIFFYSLIVSVVNIQFMKSNITTFFNQSMKKKYFSDLSMKMCSLAGVPPTTGFILKMLVLFSIIMMSSLTTNMLVVLVMSSSMGFYVYSQMMMKNSLLNKTNMSKNIKKMSKKMTFFFSSSTITAIFMIF